MSRLDNQTLTGLLFSWREKQSHLWPATARIRTHPLTLGWEILTVVTERPLLPEDDPTATDFSYEYLYRSHGPHAILVSHTSRLMDFILTDHRLSIIIRRPRVAVGRLVSELAQKPHGVYTLSKVYARVEGHGDKLRAISLYGDDLVETELLNNILPQLQPHRVELRDIERGINSLCVGIRGEIDFYYGGSTSLHAMLETLSFLSTGTTRSSSGTKDVCIEPRAPYITWE